MINYAKLMLTMLLSMCTSIIFAQDALTTFTEECVDFLEYRRSVLHWDTLGQKDIRLGVLNYLENSGCSFEGELFSAMRYYFGNPDTSIDWSKVAYENSNGYPLTFIYRVGDFINSYGTHRSRYIYVECSENSRIERVHVFTVDE